mmetsp:Transcript_41677/g.63682  ORF Transcript_41677/g.63682 Transcript_41677/m.63682 type:complete len:209 (-) Transcript_41677:1318-1944(-)
MMDYASISSNKFKKQCDVFDVKEAIMEMAEVLEIQAESMNNEVSFLFLNFQKENYYINTDKQRLQQIFYNLYANALKFTYHGKVVITCQHVADPAGKKGSIEVSVKDTGIGIAKSEQTKLFKLFGKISSTDSSNTGGIGLGLFICKQIVDQFEGQIDVISEGPGEGCDFYFHLQLEDAANISQQRSTIKQVNKMFKRQVTAFDRRIRN